MGLDILLYKLKKNVKKDNGNYLRLVNEDNGEYKNEYPEWTKAYESKIVEEWFDWEKYKEKTGIDFYKYLVESIENREDDKNIMTIIPKELQAYNERKDDDSPISLEKKEILDMDDIPVFNKEISVIGVEEIGYQRKGFNSSFYRDIESGKIKDILWRKEDVIECKEKYCIDEETKGYFQREIIDKFEEGKTCLWFSW